jgi:hypothetical protein
MDYLTLKKEIKEIVEIADSVPEAFKEKCFEVLLNHLITGSLKPLPPTDLGRATADSGLQPTEMLDLPMTAQLRVFMQRTGISEDEIKSMLLFSENDVHFVREPVPKKVAAGQIQWALLLALKNCILNNELSVDPEDVRSVCQEKGFYDAANFSATFKTPKNAKLFKGLMEAQGEAQFLRSQ